MLAPTLKRCLHTTALLRQEGAAAAAATASRKPAPTASASELANALRRVVGGARPPRAAGGAKGPNRDGDRRASGARSRPEGDRRGPQNDRRGGGNNNDRRGGGNNDRRGNSSGDRRGAQGQGQGQEQRRRRPSVLRDVRERSGGGGTHFDRGATTPALDRPLPPIEALIPRTEWSVSSSKGNVAFSRIPYTTPSELLGRPDLDALVASPASSSSLAASGGGGGSSSSSKRTRPLRNAERALRYHLSPRGNNTLGPLGAPTPIARPGAHTARATQATAAAADGDKSIKEQSRDERMRLLDETVGGDYSAQLAPALLKDSDAARQPQLKAAADALASNAELNVASRAWTLDVVRRIISRPSK